MPGGGGRYAEAEALYKRSLAIREKVLGPDNSEVSILINNLAEMYRDQGRYTEAEPLHKRSLRIREKVLGPNHASVGTALGNLAGLYMSQGRYSEAEPLYKRSLEISEKAHGPDHSGVGTALNNLALLYKTQGHYAEAEPLYKRALRVSERALGPNHTLVATLLGNFAGLYERQGRYADAAPLYKRSLGIREKALGPDHPDFGNSLNSLAVLSSVQGRYSEAEPLFKRSFGIREAALGPDHPDVGNSLNNIAALHFEQSDWAGATDFWRRATSVIIRRSKRGVKTAGQSLTGKGKSEFERNSSQFSGLVKAADRIAAAKRTSKPELSVEMFETAQWARGSEAASSLAQMAARGASADAKLASIIRERQDLVGEWQKRDAARTAAVSHPPDKRDKQAEATNVARLNKIDARIAIIDKQLGKDFPDYAVLASPNPLTVSDVQSQLGDNEVLVLFLDTSERKPTPEETFIWAVTKTNSRWVKSDIGTQSLTNLVTALRCGFS